MSAPGDDSDDALWDAVKKTLKPLHKTRAAAPPEKNAKDGKIEKPARIVKQKSLPQNSSSLLKAPPPQAPSLPPLAAFDRRTRGRIARGNTEIEGRLDLHGYKLAQAKDRLAHFLERAQASEKSLVLVITGKGTIAPQGAERGVLKREVPLWLGSPEFRSLVIGFEQAAGAHGGAGALYVRVRRKR